MKFRNYLILLIIGTVWLSSCEKENPAKKTGVFLSKNSTLGNILVDQNGMTLYFFTKDVSGSSLCEGACLDNWPVFFSENLEIDGNLDIDDFDAIARGDGKYQITYKGWPLYYFANDTKEGDVNGEGVLDVWFVAKEDYTVMLANGQLVGHDGKMYKEDYTEGEEIIQFFVDDRGRTLYAFKNDTKDNNNFTAPDFSNNGVWPIYEVAEVKSVPSQVNSSDFGVIDVFGRSQLTYKGWPLYYFGQDAETRGNTKGVSFPAPGVWPIVNKSTNAAPDGKALAEAYFNDNLKSLITSSCVSCHEGAHSSGSRKYDVFDNAYARAEDMYLRVDGQQGNLMPKGGSKLPQADIDKFEAFKNMVVSN